MTDRRLLGLELSFCKPAFICCVGRCRTEKGANHCNATSLEEVSSFLHKHQKCRTFIQPARQGRK